MWRRDTLLRLTLAGHSLVWQTLASMMEVRRLQAGQVEGCEKLGVSVIGL